MKNPAFPLYANDFYVDTITWELDELGLYTRLLFIQWANGPLENDPKKLAKIAITSLKNFIRLWETVSSKFVENENGCLINTRLEEVRQERLAFIEKQRNKGRKSAKKRWGKNVTTVTPPVESPAKPKLQPPLQPDDKPESNLSSSSSSLEEEKDIKKEKPADQSSESTPTDPPPEGNKPSKKKAPVSAYAAQMFVTFWTAYPARNGKKLDKEETFRRYCLIAEAELELVNTAARNYADSEMIQKGIGVKDPKRFLLDGKGHEYWRQWIEPESKHNDGTNKQNAKRSYEPGEHDPFDGLGKDC